MSQQAYVDELLATYVADVERLGMVAGLRAAQAWGRLKRTAARQWRTELARDAAETPLYAAVRAAHPGLVLRQAPRGLWAAVARTAPTHDRMEVDA